MAHFANSLAAHYDEYIYQDKLDFFNCISNWPGFLKRSVLNLYFIYSLNKIEIKGNKQNYLAIL